LFRAGGMVLAQRARRKRSGGERRPNRSVAVVVRISEGPSLVAICLAGRDGLVPSNLFSVAAALHNPKVGRDRAHPSLDRIYDATG
jgi:hypothetical protein